MKDLILRNRYTLLLATLIVYMGVLVAEGMITGREARVIEFENPYFDFNMNEFEGFRDRRNVNEDVRTS
ncbi:MAG: hypothetical protein COB20_07460 [SAR86 cluster bacterium]|uniref:Uncharacterized protein n=1 Tax=SAR86 cluster bacterium TaxID=2030880 RepID=A0A2A4X4Z2_9GAMM|nr:MAG: hypothetical protein COB20_07460 [SAR86 cluster bacterium]